MPLDTATQTLTLADLSWRLRHPETWPDGFRWEYNDCNCCAMGLAFALMGRPQENLYSFVLEMFPEMRAKGRPTHFSPVANEIFYNLHRELRTTRDAITPTMVANAIDEWLER